MYPLVCGFDSEDEPTVYWPKARAGARFPDLDLRGPGLTSKRDAWQP